MLCSASECYPLGLDLRSQRAMPGQTSTSLTASAVYKPIPPPKPSPRPPPFMTHHQQQQQPHFHDRPHLYDPLIQVDPSPRRRKPLTCVNDMALNPLYMCRYTGHVCVHFEVPREVGELKSRRMSASCFSGRPPLDMQATSSSSLPPPWLPS
jgi:hypothetical protein